MDSIPIQLIVPSTTFAMVLHIILRLVQQIMYLRTTESTHIQFKIHTLIQETESLNVVLLVDIRVGCVIRFTVMEWQTNLRSGADDYFHYAYCIEIGTLKRAVMFKCPPGTRHVGYTNSTTNVVDCIPVATPVAAVP
ncbi:hypothetical protein HA402_007477 [Bradysia odoriphaga]|nr:hypothetical protein HA402_007477 [Bradysia odoriphaga]